jgi:hypothetical protein
VGSFSEQVWGVSDEHRQTTSVNLHPSFAAVGIGGQRILVVPDLDLVVVITCDAHQQREDAQELVGQTIIPAVTG